MGFLRFAASTPFAMIVTALVFALMIALIDKPEPPEPEPTDDDPVITVQPPPPPPEPDKKEAEKRERGELPERPRLPQPERVDPPDNPSDTFPVGPGEISVTGERGELNIDPPVGVPLITAAPTYPAGCAARGVEGSVTLSYDIVGSGDAINIEVVNSDDRCFERAAKRAMESWKFSPDPERPGEIILADQRQTFTFELDEE